MKSVLLTGINGRVAQVMKKELDHKYDITGISLARMDDVLREEKPNSWKEQLDLYRERVEDQLTTALKGKTAVVHLGWNTRDEYWKAGLDPLNIFAVDCVYRAAIAERVPRIYMASSVHSYDFLGDGFDKDVPIPPYPDTRRDPFGVPPTGLYGVSKRWMEIAGQFYVQHLTEGQKILVVRLGGVGRHERPRRANRVWASHRDCAGLLEAFIECEDAPSFCIAYGVSDNRGGEHAAQLFDTVNPYGFTPVDNAYELEYPEDDAPDR